MNLAEEYVKENAYTHSQEAVRQAFLAGYKAGQDKTMDKAVENYNSLVTSYMERLPKWHDLRKDPNDLPKEGTLVVAIHANGNMHLHKYLDGWSSVYKERVVGAIVVPVIAWCEIPRHEEA